MRSLPSWLFAAALLPTAVALSACSDSPRPYGERTTAPPSAKDGSGAAQTPASPTTPPGVPRDLDQTKK